MEVSFATQHEHRFLLGAEMFDYKTVEEKAAEWGVSARHLQQLCRKDRIEGAIKRAGAWFIPAHTPSPVQNTRVGDKPFQFVGTKKKIFDSAIQLFVQKGYENVTMSDLAKTAGIQQSAVYNHFKSKQEILDTIYGFYYHYYLSSRPTAEYLVGLLEKESLYNVITKGFFYKYDNEILEQISEINSLIIQRASFDELALDLFYKLNLEEGIEFVEDSLNKAVETGRIAPTDTHTVAVLINCIRTYKLLWWMVDPPEDVVKRITKDEHAMQKVLASLLTDMRSHKTDR